ncbi:MAG: general secretion pathway protein GspK [Planctomycetes bacterium]|nr:general secretion pathway protein GspK [Planctomycetota bacterium]
MPAPQPISGSTRKHRRAMALLVVLLLVMLLAIVVWSFQSEVAREINVSSNVRDDLKAAYLAQMGMVRGQAVMRLDDKADYDSLNEPWAQPVSWQGETFGNTDGDSALIEPKIFITDEERKFNLLTLVRGSEKQRAAAAEVLTRLIDICRRQDDRLELDGDAKNVRRRGDDREASTENLVKNLIKYLEERATEESDEAEITAREGEAVDARSMKKQTPLPMITLGELLQIEGWSRDLLFGKPPTAMAEEQAGGEEAPKKYHELSDEEKFDERRKSVEGMDERSRDPEPLGLLQFITLYSPGQININTCPREMLLALNKDLTWDVVDTILTAREQARKDIVAADENGGTLPEEEPATNPDGSAAEEEDKASFRTQDMATLKAFGERITGEQDGKVEGLTDEIFNAIKPLLTVRSRVFMVESQGRSGKMTKTLRAVFVRTGSNPATAPATGTADTGGTSGTGTSGSTSGTATTGESGLPPDSKINLTLLLMDEIEG